MSCRRHRRGDLCDGGRPGDSCQVPLPEKRDLSEAGSEGCQTGRQPGLPESLRGKRKGVFYLTGHLTGKLEGGGGEPLPVPPQDTKSQSETDRKWLLQSRNQPRDSFVLFLYKRVKTGDKVS